MDIRAAARTGMRDGNVVLALLPIMIVMLSGFLVTGLAIGGAVNAGKVIAWIGTAMYAAFAGGAPAGSFLYARYGFSATAIATGAIPLATLVIIVPLEGIAPARAARPSFKRVVGAVARPGIGLAFSSFGFGAITTFVALVFAQQRWGAFLDLALGVANPALGAVANLAGVTSVFLGSALGVLCSAVIAVRLLQRAATKERLA